MAAPSVRPTYRGSHRYLHGPEVDQVFADEGATGAIQWALADLNGSVRDVAVQNSATDVTSIPVENHRTFDSFGVAVDATTRQPVFVTDGFALGDTGREYDIDTGLQYNRDRWYDAAVGWFVSEDPIGFSAGDANLNRYAGNSPLTHSDPSGNSWLSSLWDKGTNAVQDLAHDVGNFFEDIGVTRIRDIVNNNLSDAWDWVEEAAHDTGDFFEEQWDNGNIQKALLAASVVLTAGAAAPFLAAAGTGLMSGGLVGAWTGFVGAGITAGVSTSVGAFTAISTTISAASSAVNAYETFTGNQVGGRDFSRILGGVAMATGGINGGLARNSKGLVTGGFEYTASNVIQAGAGIAGGYEAVSGQQIGNGTFTNVMFGASSIADGVTSASRPGAWNKFSGGLSATTGSLSIAASLSGNQSMANALRVANISPSLANLGTSTYQIGAGAWNLWGARNNAPSGQHEPDKL